MGIPIKETWIRKTAVAAVLPFAALGLSGCNSESGPEEGTGVEDVAEENVGQPAEDSPGPVFEGAYEDFYDGYADYATEKVVVTASVKKIITDESFSITGKDDSSQVVLVMHEEQLPGLQPGKRVKVTGTVKRAFDVRTVEEEMGTDLDDGAHEDWGGEKYINASNVDTTVRSGS